MLKTKNTRAQIKKTNEKATKCLKKRDLLGTSMYLTKMENQSAIPKKIMSPKNRRRESRVLDIDMYINSISLCYSKQQMKKILYVVTKSNWGGAQKYVYDLATSLDKNLYEPVVVLGSTHEDEQASGVLLERLKVEGVRSIEVGSMQRDISL